MAIRLRKSVHLSRWIIFIKNIIYSIIIISVAVIL